MCGYVTLLRLRIEDRDQSVLVRSTNQFHLHPHQSSSCSKPRRRINPNSLSRTLVPQPRLPNGIQSLTEYMTMTQWLTMSNFPPAWFHFNIPFQVNALHQLQSNLPTPTNVALKHNVLLQLTNRPQHFRISQASPQCPRIPRTFANLSTYHKSLLNVLESRGHWTRKLNSVASSIKNGQVDCLPYEHQPRDSKIVCMTCIASCWIQHIQIASINSSLWILGMYSKFAQWVGKWV